MSDEEPADESDEHDEPLGDLRDDISSRTVDESSDERSPPAETADPRSPDESADDRPPEDSEEETDGPLGDLRRDLGSRTAPDESDPSDADDTAVDDRFAEMSVDDVDSEDLWADLLLDDGPTEGSFPPTATTHRSEGTFHEVTKRLCHRCEYFGDPPILHCTHEGTTIHELVDMDHYLVSDCPMVDTESETEERS